MFLHYLVRYGYRPSRIAFLAHEAWGDPARGLWPDDVAPCDRHRYDLAEITRWLSVFLQRFMANQFKRSAMPNAPKVGSGSLSPRTDWRAPSDASAGPWLSELAGHVARPEAGNQPGACPPPDLPPEV